MDDFDVCDDFDDCGDNSDEHGCCTYKVYAILTTSDCMASEYAVGFIVSFGISHNYVMS